MVSRGTSDLLVNLGIVVLVIVVIYFFIIRNPKALDWLKGIGTKTGAAQVGAASIGQTVPGPNIYPVVGDVPRSGDFGLSEASGGTSFRDNVSFPCDKCARETTWFFVPGTGGGGGSTGEDATVKMGSHGQKEDQTALIGFGSIPLGGSGGEWKSEGPHTNDAGVSGSINEGSVTLTTTEPMGIKGISWNIDPAGTQHHEIWTSNDNGANWTLAAQFEGTTEGSNALTCPIPPDGEGNCQDTLRLDGVQGYEFQRRSMVEIQSGVEPTGGGSPPTEIPTQQRDGGGGGDGDGEEPPAEEEEDGEEEEEEEEDGDGSGQNTCSNNRCTCANGSFFPLVGGQTCADCTRFCGSANQAKVLVFTSKRHLRLGNLR